MGSTNRTLQDTLQNLIEPAVEAEGMELVCLEISGSANGRKILVTIDKQNGVGIEDCAAMSRTIGTLMDVEDPVAGRYYLEVSSPGINRPLVKPEHFRRFVGERVRVRTKKALGDGRKNILGRLVACKDTPPAIELVCEGDTLVIEMENIGKAHVDFPFDEGIGKAAR